MPTTSRLTLAALVLAIAAPSAVLAQPEGDGIPDFWAIGAGYAPDYPGSDDYKAMPFGAVRANIGGVLVQTTEPGVSVTFNPEDRLRFATYARWYSGRDGDIEDTAVAQLGERDGSVVVGGRVTWIAAERVLSDYDRISLQASAGLDVTGEFDGAAWGASVTYASALSERMLGALSLGVSGFSDDYADRLFSVDAAGAVASGLAPFQAEGGVRDIGPTAILAWRVTDDWFLTGIASYSRFLGDYADSPVVADRGSKDQTFFGLAIGRQF